MDINTHKITEFKKGNLYAFTPKELRQIGAKQFKEGDIIRVSKYYIHIEYGKYNTPSLNTWIEDNNFKTLDCIAGIGTPYYIDDFKSR